MGVVIDTCVWVDVERGRLKPVEIEEKIGNVPVFLTPVILAELQYGAERAATAAQRTLRLSALGRLRRKPCLIIDHGTGEIFGQLAAGVDRAGCPSRHRVHDLWIAATCIQHGYALLTRNSADFVDIPGLKITMI